MCLCVCVQSSMIIFSGLSIFHLYKFSQTAERQVERTWKKNYCWPSNARLYLTIRRRHLTWSVCVGHKWRLENPITCQSHLFLSFTNQKKKILTLLRVSVCFFFFSLCIRWPWGKITFTCLLFSCILLLLQRVIFLDATNTQIHNAIRISVAWWGIWKVSTFICHFCPLYFDFFSLLYSTHHLYCGNASIQQRIKTTTMKIADKKKQKFIFLLNLATWNQHK